MERPEAYSTPTIANALEILGEDPAHGFTDATIRSFSAEGMAFVGRALVATLVTASPAVDDERPLATESTGSTWRAHPARL